LKTYHLIKEYGEDVNRMCRELEVNGSTVPVFHTDDFILKVTVAKVTEKLPENAKKLP
jgi:ATP-dependent DNA helicase RecG